MITVITPTVHGRESLLAECRASVRAAGLPHLVAVDSRRIGPAAVRNELSHTAVTPWLLFLDDDDLLYPEYADVVTPHLPDADVVYTDWHLTGSAFPLPELGPFDPDRLRRYNYIPVTACVRASLFRAVGGFPVGVPLEDHSLWLALLDAGARFTHVDKAAWLYRRRPDSRTGR